VPPPGQIEIPSSLASVQELSDLPASASSQNQKLVIYIQDIHTSVKVQRDIAALIEHLVKQYGVKSVAYEGNQGLINTDPVFAFPDENLKRAVSEKMLAKLRLSGAEFARVNSKTPFELWGMEDIGLYKKNLRLGEKALRVKQETLNILREIEKGLVKSFDKTASKEALALFRVTENYRAGRLELADYVEKLSGLAGAGGGQQSKWPQIAALLRLKHEEKKFIPAQIEKEFRDYSKNNNKPDIIFDPKNEELIDEFLSVPRAELAVYPELLQWVEFQRRIGDLQGEKFFAELEALRGAAERAVYSKKEEGDIAEALRHLAILSDMASLEATREQLESYWKNRERFQENYFRGFVRRVLGRKDDHARDRNLLDDLIRVADEFYAAARERDDVIARNLLKEVDQAGTVIFVAGGFHRDGITRALKQNNVSYLIVTPRYHGRDKTAEKAYFNSILGDAGRQEPVLAAGFHSRTEARMETVMNESPERRREEVIEEVSVLTKSGEFKSKKSSRKVLETAGAGSAKSLGSETLDWDTVLAKSYLVPPMTEKAAAADQNETAHEIISGAMRNGEFYFLRGDETLDARLKRFWKDALEKFRGDYPELMDGIEVSVMENPPDPIRLVKNGDGKRMFIFDDSLFLAHQPLLLAGIEEVLAGTSMVSIPEKSRVKLTAFLMAFRFLVGMMENPEGFSDTLSVWREQLKAHDRIGVLAMKDSFERQLKESKSASLSAMHYKSFRLAMTDVAVDLPENDPEIAALKKMTAEEMTAWIVSLRDYAIAGRNYRYLKANEDKRTLLEQPVKEMKAKNGGVQGLILLLAKEKDYKIMRFVRMLAPVPMGDFVTMLLEGMKQPFEPMRLSPEDVVESLVQAAEDNSEKELFSALLDQLAARDSRYSELVRLFKPHVPASTSVSRPARVSETASGTGYIRWVSPSVRQTEGDLKDAREWAEMEESRGGRRKQYPGVGLFEWDELTDFLKEETRYGKKEPYIQDRAKLFKKQFGHAPTLARLIEIETIMGMRKKPSAETEALKEKTDAITKAIKKHDKRTDDSFIAQIAPHMVVVARGKYIPGVIQIIEAWGIPPAMKALYFSLDRRIAKTEFSPDELAAVLAGVVNNNGFLAASVMKLVTGFASSGLKQIPLPVLEQIEQKVKSLSAGRSLGLIPAADNARHQILLIKLKPEHLKPYFEEAALFLTGAKNKQIIFLVSSQREKRKLKNNSAVKKFLRQFNLRDQKIQIEVNKLQSAADIAGLRNTVSLFQADLVRKNAEQKEALDIAVIAPLDVLAAAALKGVINLADDKTGAGKGAGIKDLSVPETDLVKVPSALFDTARHALSAGPTAGAFLEKVRPAGVSGVFVLSADYLAEWLGRLFQDHLIQRQSQVAA